MRPVLACQAELAGSKFQPSALTFEREAEYPSETGGGWEGGGGGCERAERDMVRSSPRSGHESFLSN